MEMEVVDFGIKDYEEILKLQLSLFERLLEEKKDGKEEREVMLIGEHTPVITLGRRGRDSNVLISEEGLKNLGIKIYHIGRGGDVTYHCQGQLIVYPILDLEKHHLGVKDYVNLLEESVIRLLQKYGISGERIDGATGVWLGKGTMQERKICAIGIKCSHFCTMHGIGLNVNSDLSGFSFINPCGFQDKGVTSMEKEICYKSSLKGGIIPEGYRLNMNEVKKDFLDIFLSLIFPL